MAKKRSTTLLRIMARLGELKFKEEYLPETKGMYTAGMWSSEGVITVNPMPHVVDTIIHECLHELDPTATEKQIQRKTKRIRLQLSEEEIQTIYAEYKRKINQ